MLVFGQQKEPPLSLSRWSASPSSVLLKILAAIILRCTFLGRPFVLGACTNYIVNDELVVAIPIGFHFDSSVNKVYITLSVKTKSMFSDISLQFLTGFLQFPTNFVQFATIFYNIQQFPTIFYHFVQFSIIFHRFLQFPIIIMYIGTRSHD